MGALKTDKRTQAAVLGMMITILATSIPMAAQSGWWWMVGIVIVAQLALAVFAGIALAGMRDSGKAAESGRNVK